MFAPPYEPLPKEIKFFYNGKEMRLSQDCEEVAAFYAHMLDHDYVTKEVFNKNFFKDWRKFMTPEEKETIVDLKKCDFTHMNTYFKGRRSVSELISLDTLQAIALLALFQQNLKRRRIVPRKKS